MKRCIFAGPSLHGVAARPPEIQFCPPARRADLLAAVEEGYEWIGLVDGYFGTCASVWHKEILYALSKGCLVWGAASMGAIRAAECRPFGMRAVGVIAWQYANGYLTDDADVALLHGPQEVDYAPLTEALVDMRATISAMRLAADISDDEHRLLRTAAESLHFSDRTVEAIVERAMGGSGRRAKLTSLFQTYRVNAKRMDAIQLMDEMRGQTPIAERLQGLVNSASLADLVGR